MRRNIHGNGMLVMLCAAGAIQMFCSQYVVVISPHLRELLRLTPDALGLILSAPLVSGIVGTLIGGWLADRPRLRLSASAMILLPVIGYAIVAWPPAYSVQYDGFGTQSLVMTQPGFSIVFTGLVFAGAGMAGFFTLANVVITRVYSESSRRALSWFQLSAAASGIIAPIAWDEVSTWLIGTQLGEDGRSMQVVFVALAIGCATVIPLLASREMPDPPAKKVETARTTTPTLPWVPLIAACLFISLHTASDNGIFFWIPDFIANRFDPAQFPAAWILSAYSAAYFVGRLVLTRLPDEWDDLIIIAVASSLGGILTFLAFRSTNQYLLAALYTSAGLCMSMNYPALISHIGKQFPQATGRIMAISGSAGSMVSFALPPLMGYIGRVGGSSTADMTLPSIMLMALSGLVLVWREILKRKAAAGTATVRG
jgi:MFS family permease